MTDFAFTDNFLDQDVIIATADDGDVDAKGSQVAKQTIKCTTADCSNDATMTVGIGYQSN